MDTPVFKEPLLGYYPCCIGFLTGRRKAVDGTVSVGQFDWGGRLPKSNGGAQRYPQLGWKPRLWLWRRGRWDTILAILEF